MKPEVPLDRTLYRPGVLLLLLIMLTLGSATAQQRYPGYPGYAPYPYGGQQPRAGAEEPTDPLEKERLPAPPRYQPVPHQEGSPYIGYPEQGPSQTQPPFGYPLGQSPQRPPQRYDYGQPQQPAPQQQYPGYGQPQQPASPQQYPGYGQSQQPAAPQQYPGYGQPQQPASPQQYPGYGQPQQPAAPQQYPGYGQPPQPAASQQYPRFQQPTAPQQYPGFRQPQQQPATEQWHPGYGQPPGSAFGQPPAGTANRVSPVAVIKMAERHPYVQQTSIMTLQVSSSENIATIDPQIPNTSSLVFKRLGDRPATSTRMRGGKQIITHEFHYAVTPLQEGSTEVPEIRVTGTFASIGNQPFESEPTASIPIQVLPMDLSVHPWLPLHGLILESHLEEDAKPAAGQPIILNIQTSAIGASGNQLPSLEKQLNTTDFRVYREDSETEGVLSGNKKYLTGRRSERFTLVPLHGGKIQIPELKIRWWNVDLGREETTTVPIRQLIANGNALAGKTKDLFPGATSLLLWVPLVGVFGVTVGFWILAWLRKKRFVQVAEEEISLLTAFASQRARLFLAWLAPIRRIQKMRQLFVRSLPRSFRLWFCVRLVNHETEPEDWTYMLKFLANKHLSIPAQLPLGELGGRLSSIHARSDHRVMADLMRELEAALYGSGTIDFPAWKRAFRRQLRPAWWRSPRLNEASSRKARHLPSLNPGT